MNTPDFHEEHAALQAALQRAAARMPQPAFDPALHASTMRRLEALTRTNPPRASFRWTPLTAVAGLLVLSLAKLTWFEKRPAPPQRAVVKSALRSASSASQASLPPLTVAYERAAAQDDEQFFALLDHAASQPSFISPPVSSHPSLLQR